MRWLLAVLQFLLLASPAFACPPPAPCDDMRRIAPLDGAEVPRNAKIWIAGDPPWVYDLHDGTKRERLEPVAYDAARSPVIALTPALEPGKHYRLDGPGGEATSFTVGDKLDLVPPGSPRIRERELSLSGSRLWLAADIADDTALLRIEIEDQHTKLVRAVIASPQKLPYGCAIDYTHRGVAPACITLTAIDLAGNESAPTRHCMTTRGVVTDGAPIEVTLVHLGPPLERDNPSAMLAIALVIALLVGVFMAFAPEIDMGWLRRRQVGHELLPAAARHLARITLRSALLRTLLVGGATVPLVAFVTSPVVWFAGLGAVLVAARQLWLFVRARHMIDVLDRVPDALVTLHGDHVVRVAADGEVAWLVVSPRQLAIATDRVLPAARVVEKG